MDFSEEERTVPKFLCQNKNCDAKWFFKLSGKGWTLSNLNKLLQNINVLQ